LPDDEMARGQVAGRERIEVEDFDAPRDRAAGLAAAIQAVATADTVVPHQDFFDARDALEQLLGGFQAIATAFATAVPDVAGKENIIGLGVGMRFAADALTGDLAVKVFVREKLPESELAKSARIPREVDGVPTDVEAIGEVLPFSYAKRYPRPVPCGVSCGHFKLPGSGTIGCVVELDNGKVCILSNNHVLANENNAQVGDPIIQPGNAEPVGAPDEKIGLLEKFIALQATDNLVDAAVAWTNLSRVSPKHVTYTLNPIPVAATTGLSVMKNGRTTQSTLGMVTDIGVVVRVGYTPFPAGAGFRNQIGVRGVAGPFSKPGDSGSLIVTAGTKQPVALLFAGSTDNMVTFANPIQTVISELGIKEFIAE
jgi:hypothetical protein